MIALWASTLLPEFTANCTDPSGNLLHKSLMTPLRSHLVRYRLFCAPMRRRTLCSNHDHAVKTGHRVFQFYTISYCSICIHLSFCKKTAREWQSSSDQSLICESTLLSQMEQGIQLCLLWWNGHCLKPDCCQKSLLGEQRS